jgi:hypothetical protein
MSNNKIYYDWNNIERWCNRIALDILKTDWRPDYIVGITRGGLIPATILSHLMDTRMYTLDVRLREGDGGCESNLWMSEDAFGYNEEETKKILIVDDINDTGATFAWIKKDWRSSCLPNDSKWDNVWHNNVKFAAVINNLASKECVDWAAMDINKEENPSWIVFPWESREEG